MHLLIDGFGGDIQKMKEEDFVYRFLDDYPSEIGMTKISVPHVITYVGPKGEDWGVSGFVMIAESHISVHTFPERAYVNIDVFSCKDFDDKRALQQIKEAFSLDQAKVWVIDRGLDRSRPAFRGSEERGQARESVIGV
ncbi:MAG: adenosylmethionine decarboxylase [Chloroflexi bacterium]|nr:adenosylmethionine decarboxylase [Chloroflexota bacterium]